MSGSESLSLDSGNALHDGTLLLEGSLDLGETVGDGHGCLEFGDDLYVVTQLYAQKLGCSLKGLKGGGGQSGCTGYLIEDTGVRCRVPDGVVDIGHGVTGLAGTFCESLYAGGHSLAEGALFLLVGQ